MTPPELAGDAPIPKFCQPIAIHFLPAIGNEIGRILLIQAIESKIGERANFHEPLSGEEGFDGNFSPIAVGNGVGVLVDFHQTAIGF